MFHVTNIEAPNEFASNTDMMNDDIAKKLKEVSLEDQQKLIIWQEKSDFPAFFHFSGELNL